MRLTVLSGRAPVTPVKLMYRVYRFVLPEVRAELRRLRELALAIPDEELRTQAIASMSSKAFHCQGGAVYAAANLRHRHILIPLIVALQTISDYLDNLCDRSTSQEEKDFRLLHQAMLDAVDPDAPLCDYYAKRNERDDGGYLQQLVQTCQQAVSQLPGYQVVRPYVHELVGMYNDLQVYKHIRHDLREASLLAWWNNNRWRCDHLQWNEFAAGTGSTLGMFMLFLAACDSRINDRKAQAVRDAYFPHVCGLHIMLDYLIDQEEDRIGGDLNFCSYYRNQSELTHRLAMMVDHARRDIRSLPNWRFHRMIIEGLLALYLSDPKARLQEDVRMVSRQLMRRSPLTRLFFWGNSILIRMQEI